MKSQHPPGVKYRTQFLPTFLSLVFIHDTLFSSIRVASSSHITSTVLTLKSGWGQKIWSQKKSGFACLIKFVK